jgi:hypothetical protein
MCTLGSVAPPSTSLASATEPGGSDLSDRFPVPKPPSPRSSREHGFCTECWSVLAVPGTAFCEHCTSEQEWWAMWVDEQLANDPLSLSEGL